MLPEEYERRRRLPRHLREPEHREPDFAFTIRPAEARDLPVVRDIYRHYVLNSTVTFDEKPKSLPQWRRTLREAAELNLAFLVAESATGTVLGYALVQPWKQRAAYRYTVESSVYLAPAAGGRGLGRALMEALIETTRARGVREMIAVIADQGADASVALHEKLGFEEIGRMGRVGHKFGRDLGIVLLQKSLRKKR
ncbi:GNAT family N-acetyltransferase [Agrococcus beijingensis]|uniref:GNAT family N-acetyltransferase n=1 Tax=Agrococcus beijingensis TaxID=3068634 RepID=UPI0027424F9D|nr:GNAT family N-acetyltransferase [Agrococcus sp. REN33]